MSRAEKLARQFLEALEAIDEVEPNEFDSDYVEYETAKISWCLERGERLANLVLSRRKEGL